MKGSVAPRILAVPLFVALLAAPAILQEGLFSLRDSWALSLLAALCLFALVLAAIAGPMALVRRFARRSGNDAVESGAPEDSADEEQATEADDEASEEPDITLADALSELQPDNFMDLARALQEMGRDADTLEVLAQVIERKEGDYEEEVAAALRRLRHKLGKDISGST